MSIFPCPNCYDEPLPIVETPCWKCGSTKVGTLDPPRSPQAAAERQRIVDNARQLRVEIEQIFNDCAHWNESVRKPDEQPIDPDPGGRLRRIADGLDRMLATEPVH